MGLGKFTWGSVFAVALSVAGVGTMQGMAPALRAATPATHGPGAQTPAPARAVGTIKSISGNTIVLTSDAGSDVSIVVQEAAKLVQIAPGQKDLKDAAPIGLSDLLPGDRILARGQLGDDGKTVLASSVIAMKKADIAGKRAQEREEWQRHGIAGLVSSTNPSANTIMVTLPGLGDKKTVTIHVSKDTILRRYAPDSVKFDDAKPAPLQEIKPGDQLRARGTRSADGTELAAAEVVSGTFRNISGLIASMDAASSTITLQDLATKKTVTVKITADSQLRKLPAPMAQRIAARLKGVPADAAPGAPGTAAGASASTNPNGTPAPRAAGAPPGGAGPGGGAGRNGGVGAGDLQQVINRMPAVTLAELQKGDAVMMVATEGGPGSVPSAIILLSGVELILEASPSSASTILSPWSLAAAPAEAGNP